MMSSIFVFVSYDLRPQPLPFFLSWPRCQFKAKYWVWMVFNSSSICNRLTLKPFERVSCTNVIIKIAFIEELPELDIHVLSSAHKPSYIVTVIIACMTELIIANTNHTSKCLNPALGKMAKAACIIFWAWRISKGVFVGGNKKNIKLPNVWPENQHKLWGLFRPQCQWALHMTKPQSKSCDQKHFCQPNFPLHWKWFADHCTVLRQTTLYTLYHVTKYLFFKLNCMVLRYQTACLSLQSKLVFLNLRVLWFDKLRLVTSHWQLG